MTYNTKQKIILATNNRDKIKEFNSLLTGQPLTTISQGELNIPEVEETGLTFVENAILKARHASLYGNLPAIADDSGVMVDALHGAPGIYSARYAAKCAGEGESTSCTNVSYRDNIDRLLFELRDVPIERRGAQFYSVIVYLQHAADPAPLICQGIWRGSIIFAPRGNNGFGYDPIFWVPTHNCTAAELPAEIKNQISHRGQAISNLVRSLDIIV